MHLPDTNPYHVTEVSQTAEGPAKAIDFMVDSAGNVSPLTKRKAESLAGSTAPPQGRWSRSS